jgi:hypothetical protein
MRIVEKLVMGDDGLVQLLRTEDSSVGSKYVYEEMSYAEYSRVIQLLSVIVLQEVGSQAQAKGVRAAAIEKSQRLATRERPLWSTAPALYAEMLPLMSTWRAHRKTTRRFFCSRWLTPSCESWRGCSISPAIGSWPTGPWRSPT